MAGIPLPRRRTCLPGWVPGSILMVVYDFYDLYIKRIKEAKINWEQEKFNQTYDNINVLDCLKKIEFDGKTFIPIHISEMIKNKLNEKKCFYRLNTLKNNNITNYGKSELNNVSI